MKIMIRNLIVLVVVLLCVLGDADASLNVGRRGIELGKMISEAAKGSKRPMTVADIRKMILDDIYTTRKGNWLSALRRDGLGPADAEDAMQEIAMLLHWKVADARSLDGLPGYLGTIAKNEALGRLRADCKRDMIEVCVGFCEDLRATVGDFPTSISDREAQVRLRDRAFAEMTEAQTSILRDRHEGAGFKTIAEARGIKNEAKARSNFWDAQRRFDEIARRIDKEDRIVVRLNLIGRALDRMEAVDVTEEFLAVNDRLRSVLTQVEEIRRLSPETRKKLAATLNRTTEFVRRRDPEAWAPRGKPKPLGAQRRFGTDIRPVGFNLSGYAELCKHAQKLIGGDGFYCPPVR